MANPLNQEVEGKVVILRADALKPGVDPRFFCEGGFGCYPFTSGTKIHGRFIADGDDAVIHSSMIDRLCEDQSVRPPMPATT